MAGNSEDKEATKLARSVFNRRGIDISQSDVRVAHGILYLRGTVKIIPGANKGNAEEEIKGALKAIRQKPGIRDIVAEFKIHGQD